MEKQNKSLKVLRKRRLCKCGGEGQPRHTCPYSEDVHNDSETKCNCCEACQHECAMDI